MLQLGNSRNLSNEEKRIISLRFIDCPLWIVREWARIEEWDLWCEGKGGGTTRGGGTIKIIRPSFNLGIPLMPFVTWPLGQNKKKLERPCLSRPEKYRSRPRFCSENKSFQKLKANKSCDQTPSTSRCKLLEWRVSK